MPMSNVVGADPSSSAIELARAKAQLVQEATVEYAVSFGFPTPLPEGAFSHVFSLHPSVPSPEDRVALFKEIRRLLEPGGQLVMALPLRGSFQEVLDLVREYALKNDAGEIGKAAEAAGLLRPTMESLTEELETAGFDDVDIVRQRASLEFQSGRDFFEDPVARLLVLPDVRGHLPGLDLAAAFTYVREAIDRYWSETRFDLSVHVGCVSARVP
jgi:SAM-dependent methyltransferase